MSEPYLWKVALGVPGRNEPLDDWIYVIAPDVATAERVIEEWLEGDANPREIVLEVRFVKSSVLSSADMVRDNSTLEWAEE